jgi:HD-GYP domain-containing protein (c-di-GMP phosphodiesterase class II)
MPVQNKKVPASNIVIGMYISSLDRPWIDTDFLLEGFYVETTSDIERLETLCQFVYIDIELTKQHVNIHLDDEKPSLLEKIKTIATTDVKDISFNRNESAKIPRERIYEKSSSFATEFRTANRLYKDISKTASQIFSDVSSGNKVNLTLVKRDATAVVDSVVRNPDAFLWLTRLHEKDTHTHSRSLRTSIWAIAFARYLGLERFKLNDLSSALLLCNIGKAQLPIELLLKNEDMLTNEELLEYQKHIDYTLESLKIMGRTPQAIITIIRSHCERFDGSGYPMGLNVDEIPLLAQIAGLVSYYEEITNCRKQEDSLDPARAIEHLYTLRNHLFMSDLVEEFIASIGIYPVGSVVELNSHEIAIIVEQNNENKLLPQVLILRDSQRKRVTLFKLLDLYQINQEEEIAPKIINTYPLGKFGIDIDEVTIGLARATEDNNESWNLKKFLKKIIP